MFFPSPQSTALHLDQEMRDDLGRSLERLAGMASSVLPTDVDMALAAEQARHHQLSPGVFARYYELIHALQQQAFDRAGTLWREIADGAAEEISFDVRPFDITALGDDAARFQRLLAMGWHESIMFSPPDAAAWVAFQSHAWDGLELLAEVCPSWRQELEALIGRIYGALPSAGEGQRFAGASCFMVWGAIFINVRKANGRIHALAGLVHEATHQMLFGASRREGLVTNDPAERYSSPLRRDPRPMDGVFHATYVSARLSYLYSLLRDADVSAEERSAAAERVGRQRQRFEQGYAVLCERGRLTPLGARLIEEAHGAMLDMVTP